MGADPIEGFTSFLWVVIGAISHSLGVDPVAFLKAVSLLSALVAISTVYSYARWRGVGRTLTAMVTAQIALSPAVTFLAIQGLETLIATALVTIAGVGMIEYRRTGAGRCLALFYLVGFAAMLTRPGLVFFMAFAAVAALAVDVHEGRWYQVRRIIGHGAAFAGFPGLLYMAWRVSYFGFLFPNPFYAKSGGTFSLWGAIFVFEFVMIVVGPLLFIALYVLGRYSDTWYETSKDVLPVLISAGIFPVIWLFVGPAQAYL